MLTHVSSSSIVRLVFIACILRACSCARVRATPPSTRPPPVTASRDPPRRPASPTAPASHKPHKPHKPHSQSSGFDMDFDSDWMESICMGSDAISDECTFILCPNLQLSDAELSNLEDPTEGMCRCICCDQLVPTCARQLPESDSVPVFDLACSCEMPESTLQELSLGPDGGAVADCVETAWLKQHGHATAILRERPSSTVLCMPNMPCGTPGHLLRDCASERRTSCRLRTYAQICAERGDCRLDFLPVSRLRHSHDWSCIRSATSDGGVLEMTSVSVFPDSARLSASYVIAFAADVLGSLRLGFVCDFVLLVVLWAERVGERLLKLLNAFFNARSSVLREL